MVFLAALSVLAVAAALLTFHYRILQGDALSRTYSAAVVLYDLHPRLANIGFIWAPLPTLLQIPLVLYRPLMTDGFAGALLTALAGALGLVLMDRILARHVPNRAVRFLLLFIYQTNVMIFYYSINGMTEVILIAVALACWDQFERLNDELSHANGVSQVAMMGICAGLTFLTRYEGSSFGVVMYLALLIILVANGRKLGGISWSSTWRRLTLSEGAQVIEGYSLAYLTPFAYAVFLWLFFNWMIMGDPFSFMFGKGSNGQQVATLLASSKSFASMKGNMFLSSIYAAKLSVLVFPGFYVALLLLLLLAIHKRDPFAASLAVVTASFPAFQALMLYAGQSFGFTRFFIYIIPFSIVALAYAFRMFTDVYHLRKGLVHTLLISLTVLSSAMTLYGISTPDVANSDDIVFVQAIVRNAPVDNYAGEKEIADYLAQIPSGRTILTDDQQADHIIMFTQQFERFVTTRNPDFINIVRNPVGQVDYVLVPHVDPSRDLIVQEHPGIYDYGAPFLRLERVFTGKDSDWKLYRVVDPAHSKEGR